MKIAIIKKNSIICKKKNKKINNLNFKIKIMIKLTTNYKIYKINKKYNLKINIFKIL